MGIFFSGFFFFPSEWYVLGEAQHIPLGGELKRPGPEVWEYFLQQRLHRNVCPNATRNAIHHWTWLGKFL